MVLSATDILHLKEALQVAVVKCSERCLYQSAKWYAAQMRAPDLNLDVPDLIEILQGGRTARCSARVFHGRRRAGGGGPIR